MRLKIEQARLERERQRTEEEVVEHFKRWAQNPAVREAICGKCLSPEEREARIREIYGLAPKPTAEAEDLADIAPNGSSPVHAEPNQSE